ncbi:hypothetical protein [Pontixanthobacter aquaemixtae]|uniref:Uncharacterized protein n=1 Tax=Pontixanthobacter aquaemixtae TaxID=1958940 RepID=A0A844ZUF2_9SPHN|nr:hypothetical protein [Pontixanthobacter aquaemixtae]MXO91368.1 hypothetical protein [Pontixanthobacter aquaemixtae]
MKRILVSAAIASAAMLPGAVSAQDEVGPSDDVCMAIVYGEDEAPACDDGMIVVIARLPDGDRYRIPENLRFSDDPENTAWARRVESLEMIGSFGALSCSTAAAGGFTGCTQQLLEQAYGEKRNSSNVRFSELIAAARAERLSSIDAEAAAEQQRVEQIEREYMERLEAERDAPTPDETAEESSNLPDPGAQTDG